MTQKDFVRLARLAAHCDTTLSDKMRQSMNIWRGDMRAIVAAYRELQKLRDTSTCDQQLTIARQETTALVTGLAEALTPDRKPEP